MNSKVPDQKRLLRHREKMQRKFWENWSPHCGVGWRHEPQYRDPMYLWVTNQLFYTNQNFKKFGDA